MKYLKLFFGLSCFIIVNPSFANQAKESQNINLKTNNESVSFSKHESQVISNMAAPADKVKEIVNLDRGVDCNPNSPCMVIKQSSEVLVQAVNSKLSAKKSLQLIQNSIVPQIDFSLVTKLVMGLNWKKATPKEQDAILQSFKTILVYTYASSLSKLEGARVNINSSQIIGNKLNKAIVISTVSMPNNGNSNNQPINVEYDLAQINNTWKIYDLKIENVSLVTTYRAQFNDGIQKNGIPGFIESLQTKVKTINQ